MVFVKAVVVQNDHEDEQAQASLDSGDTQQVVLEIRSGAHKGEKVDAYSLNGYLYGANCKVGTKVIASLSEYDGTHGRPTSSANFSTNVDFPMPGAPQIKTGRTGAT